MRSVPAAKCSSIRDRHGRRGPWRSPSSISASSLFRLAGPWRWIYIVGAVLALYLNVFVLVVQAFGKLPPLHRLAPTGSEPPFAIAQGLTLVLFIVLGTLAFRRFRPAA